MDERTQNVIIGALIGLIVLLVAVFGGLLIFGGGGGGVDARVLFIGNSYTAFNDMPDMTAEFMERAVSDWRRVEVESVTTDGYRLSQHAEDLARADSAINQALAEEWDLIVMQDQSQVPGFPTDNGTWIGSSNAAITLSNRAREIGATPMLFMTWGYAEGDPTNATYEDYLAMQNRVARGYFTYAERSGAFLAPVGYAFQNVYNDEITNGRVPTSPGNRFRQLFADDGQHPSQAGSYLAAAVIAANYTAQPVSDIEYRPRQLDPDYAAYLRQVADRTVFGE